MDTNYMHTHTHTHLVTLIFHRDGRFISYQSRNLCTVLIYILKKNTWSHVLDITGKMTWFCNTFFTVSLFLIIMCFCMRVIFFFFLFGQN